MHHVTALLKTLQRLPIDLRIKPKLLIVAFKTLYELATACFSNILSSIQRSPSLSSSHTGLFSAPWTAQACSPSPLGLGWFLYLKCTLPRPLHDSLFTIQVPDQMLPNQQGLPWPFHLKNPLTFSITLPVYFLHSANHNRKLSIVICCLPFH